MSDIILNIKLTETEVIHITDALHARIDDLNDALTFAGDPVIQDQIAELTELLDDLREQCARHDDGWNNPEDPDLFMDPVDFAAKHDPLINHTFSIAEQDFIQQGIDAREQKKASSMAADRRAERMMKGTATAADPDTWPLNDPADW